MWKVKDFISQKETVINHFKKNGVSQENIAEYASTAGVPIVIICEFIKQDIPEHTEMCNKKIRDIKEFFGIKD